jgi:hypothetical protein
VQLRRNLRERGREHVERTERRVRLQSVIYSGSWRPADVPARDFEKSRPLAEDMVARGVRAASFLAAFA